MRRGRFGVALLWVLLGGLLLMVVCYLYVTHVCLPTGPMPAQPLPIGAMRLDAPAFEPVFRWVITFTGRQLPKLIRNLLQWNLHPPLGIVGQRHKQKVKVTLYLDGGWGVRNEMSDGPQMRRFLENFWQSEMDPSVRNAIELSFDGAGLEADVGHPDSPCRVFHQLIADSPDYGHVLLMEPDVFPIGKGWLNAPILSAANNHGCKRFWVEGSISRCNAEYGEIGRRRDYHVNGNALYCVDPEFRSFLERVKTAYPAGTPPSRTAAGCSTGAAYESGYDHAMFQYLRRAENFEQLQRYISRFSYTDWIQNRCEDNYDPKELVFASQGRTVMVHSKSAFRAPEEKLVQTLFRKYRPHEYLSNHDLLKWANRLRSHELDPTSLSADLQRQPMLPWKERWAGKYYMWTADFHPAPMSCHQPILSELGVVLHAEVDFGLCEHFGNCKDRLKLLNNDHWRGFSLDPCPARLKHQVYGEYVGDEEMGRVDIVSCSHPVANCELWMGLNRSMLLYPTTRLEFGRYDSNIDWRQPYIDEEVNRERWHEWLMNLHVMAKRPNVVLAANSMYDVEYVRWHTGLRPIYLPSWCGGPDPTVERLQTWSFSWAPSQRDFLIGPSRDNLDLGPNCMRWVRQNCDGNQHPLMIHMRHALALHNDENRDHSLFVTRLKDRYGHNFEWREVMQHPGVVLMSYQASIMAVFQFYRYNIPLFAPSPPFLFEWIRNYNYGFERIYGWPDRNRTLVELNSNNDLNLLNKVPNPNSDNIESLRHWIPLYDIYQFPHIIQFNSWPHLFQLMRDTDLVQVSKSMAAENTRIRQQIKSTWKTILEKLADHTPPGKRNIPDTRNLNHALRSIYGPHVPLVPPNSCS